MRQFAYLGVLATCLLGTASLEIFLRTRVYRRWQRLVLTLVPVVFTFTLWDVYAISRAHWSFAPQYVTGIIAIANVPLEEICFFIAIPICSILTLEAVRSMKNWSVGDESETGTGDTK
ncbi:MAG: lycopene cyclase domain-containing protein [Actinobacteria bacterium]|nr:lycopene cyclase domain-containing protein [Actinomycetota bacterium]NBY15382.1 lycopene cyclase domain-containing protein [Actinomycetota bacterium]